jgi:hypothetical protein
MSKTQQLVDLLNSKSVTTDELDDLVHEVMSNRAAEINNNGLQAQAECLLSYYGNDTAYVIERDINSKFEV